VEKVWRRRRSPSGRERGGELDLATEGHHRHQGQAARADRKGGATTEECGVRLGNPNCPTIPTGFIPLHLEPYAAWALQAMWTASRAALWSVAWATNPCGPDRNPVVGPISFKKIVPLLFLLFYFLFLVCSLNFNSNLVSIPASSCNPVEIFHNIVMINFMFRL
jgi:hypothetical protein